MPKVTEAHRAARREEILSAAMRVFKRKGFRGASMADVIAEAGLSAGAIYSYFDGKQSLFAAVVERVLAARSEEFAAQLADAPRSPAALVQHAQRTMIGKPIMAMAPQIWAEAAVEAETREVLQRVFGHMTGLFRAELEAWGRANAERIPTAPEAWAARVAPALVSFMPGFILLRLLMPDFDDEAHFAAFDDLFIG